MPKPSAAVDGSGEPKLLRGGGVSKPLPALRDGEVPRKALPLQIGLVLGPPSALHGVGVRRRSTAEGSAGFGDVIASSAGIGEGEAQKPLKGGVKNIESGPRLGELYGRGPLSLSSSAAIAAGACVASMACMDAAGGGGVGSQRGMPHGAGRQSEREPSSPVCVSEGGGV
mmetsp:Transcript_25953/g.44878  ORF Transcript_25953/g.44878 Transcript_25953/m.44878 type:complete len:170 (-) Transcript_25953:54-563(-)